VNIVVYGIERITSNIQSVNVGNVVHLFKGISKYKITRPTGSVDVLNGYSYAGLHPEPEQKSQHLLLLKKQFGRYIGGSHPKFTESDAKINHLCVHTVSPISIEDF